MQINKYGTKQKVKNTKTNINFIVALIGVLLYTIRKLCISDIDIDILVTISNNAIFLDLSI